MKFHRSLWLVAFALLIAGAPLLADEDPPSADDQASDFAKDFKRAYKKKTSSELITDVDTIVAYMKNPEVTEKSTKKALLDSLAKAATVKDATVRTHVMKVCAGLDETVVKLVIAVLQKELKARIPEEDVYEAAFEALGKLHSPQPSAIKVLTDLLKNNDSSLVAQSCYAISGYAQASGNIRKEFFEEVLKQSEGTYNSSQGSDENAKRRWTIIGDGVLEVLNKLSVPPRTEADFSNPAVARGWYNKNKKIPWDAR